MSYLEIFAFIVSVAGVTLTVFRSMWNWLFNFLSYVLYGYLFFTYQLYAEVILQVFFVIMGTYGFCIWFKTKKIDHDIVIEPLSQQRAFMQLIGVSLLGGLLGWLLKQYTPAALPLLDAQLAALSLLATYWTSKKHIATWKLWIAVDIVYVGMFTYKSLYLTAVLYAVFVILAIYGWYTWAKVAKNGLYKS